MHDSLRLGMFVACARYFSKAVLISVIASILVTWLVSDIPNAGKYATDLASIEWLLGIVVQLKAKSQVFKRSVGIAVLTAAWVAAYLAPSPNWGMEFSWVMVAFIPLAWATHDIMSDMLQAERVRPFKRR